MSEGPIPGLHVKINWRLIFGNVEGRGCDRSTGGEHAVGAAVVFLGRGVAVPLGCAAGGITDVVRAL